MLRQNRYKIEDFYTEIEQLQINDDEILISSKHGMVISLEPHQLEKIDLLKPFIIEIIKNIPRFDNEVQDYDEQISNHMDFPLSLEVVYFENNEVLLDYWHEECNSQFTVNFCYENRNWIMKTWNGIIVVE